MKKKILAVFLSLCMAMSLLPVTVLAAEDGTAVTDNTTELRSGKYYVSNDITLNHSLTIPAGETVTLDLRGQTLTLQQLLVNGSLTIYDSQSKGQITSTITDQKTGAIEVGTAGLLTLRSGTISSPGYGVYVFDGGKTIVNGGMITSFYAPLTGNNTTGDMNFEVNGGTLTASKGPAIYMPGQVSLKITDGTLNGGISLRMGQVDISGGTINAITDNIDPITGYYNYSGNAWLADALYVFNGTYTSENASYGNSLNLNITGGTFNCTNDQGSAVAIYDLGKVAQNSQVNISGDAVLNSSADGRGAYQVLSLADVGVAEPDEGYGKEEYVGKVSTTITGGTFSSDVKEYFPEGAFLTQDTTGAVTPRDPVEGETVIAEVNSVPYDSIKNAINAAQDGDTVVLKATSTSDDSIVISDGRSIKLDMNGFDIEFANKKNISLYHGELNITGKGMLYEESPWFGPVMIYGAEEDVSNYSVVTIGENVTLRGWSGLFIDKHDQHGAKAYGIVANIYGTLESVKDTSGAGGHALYINGTIKETTGNVPKITLDGATLKTELGNGMYLAGYADTTIVDSTITSIGKDSTGIEIRAGKLTIEGNTTVRASQGKVEVRPNGNGSTSANVALAVAQHTTGLPIDLDVKGGTFIGGGALNEMNPEENDASVIDRVKLNVSGGNFIGIVDSQDVEKFISSGNFSNSVNQDYLDNLTAELYSLRNTEAPYSYYPTVADAQAAAQPGDVVTDLTTVEENANEFIVVFDYGDGTKKELTMYEGAETTLPTLNDRGYNHFVGWTDGKKTYAAGDEVKITANTTFTAQWAYISPANPNYRIDIPAAEGGTVTADPAAAKAGATVTLTATPDEGYAVGTITVTDRFGDAVKVTENADGTYTFTMPNGQVTVKATFVETEEPAPAEPFPDVDENDWFYDEVVYVYENGLMNGVENNQFAPNTATNRAMLATILYRLAGEPAVSGDLPFTDVESGTWYTDAVLWAAQNGIVNGLGENTFAPMNTLTREQLVTMLYRYAEAAGYDVSAAADLSGYPDAGKVQTYAQKAMSWAVAEGIVEGMDGNLNPAGNATRAQIATILMRFCEGVAK